MANKKLNAVITIGGALAGSFRTVIGSTTKELGKIGTEITKVKQNQRQLGEAIRTFGGMGKNVDNLRSKYSLVTAELKKLENQQLRLSNIEKQRIANNNRLSEIKGQIGATIATGLTLAAPIKTAIDFETAMLGVAKQLDGARDSAGNLTKDFFNMQKEILTIADNSPVARNEIAEMVSAGLRMGVAKNEVIGFTQEVIKMGTAFDLPMGQLADDMGKIGNMYKIPMTQIGKLADTINYLDDNSLSKGGDIIDFMQRVGGTASMVKITDKNTAALGSTLLSLGEKAETASTAVNAVFSKLGAANTGSKPFKAMVEEIGLTTVELEKGMQTNATETIFKVMDAIKKLPKEASMEKLWVPPKMSKDGKKQLKAGYYAETPATTQIDAVSTLFGAEHWDTFSKLLENRSEFEKQIGMANSNNAQGSMDKEYQARMKTTQAQIDMFKNRIGHLGVEFGSVLLPVINDVLGSVGSFATKIADWTQKNPELTATIVKTVAALGALKIGLLVAKFAIFTVNNPLIKLTGLFIRAGVGGNTFTKVLKLMKTPISGLEKGFFALKNKIVSVTGSIFKFVRSGTVLQTVLGKFRGLGVGAFNLLKNSVLGVIGVFGRFKNFVFGAIQGIFRFATSGNVIRTVFNVALNVVKQVGLALLRTPWGIVAAIAIGAALAIYKHWDQIKAFFTGFWQGLKKGIEPFTTAVVNLVQSTPLLSAAWDLVSTAVSTAFNWFKNLLKPVDATKEQIGKATSAGETFGKLVGGAINLVLTPLKAVVNLFGWIVNNVGKVGSLIDKVSNFKVGESIKSLFTGSPAKINTESKVSQPPKSIAAPTMKPNNFLGSTVRERNSNDGLQNSPKQVAPPPPMRATRPEQKTPPQVNFTNTFTINAQPGQSTDQIADDVIRKMKQAQGVQQRSLMVDWGYSQ
ncbi:phage tail tape measure protein [Acinetobacter ursingii]|uniref:Phage tail tape measure protein n=1 Tax=Acinetobacter ursingii TaxID=108980 RepID=A0AA46S809_9GAMM|nr:phage tail tape measure protein [Acinetobacter ursingii]UYF76587.1 phage tail tape measure protein [Acinetobacter ursingii]